ncbi:MAG: hypothetical protein H6652_19470 [Ardenticatenaceae bacterium]|nr:hypothetical protein [Ardenticatenaceae bacterium]
MKINYKFRVKQRSFYFRAGMGIGFLGFLLFAFLMLAELTMYLKFAMFFIGIGVFSTFCSQVGWSNILIIDLIFNQLSVVIILVGIGVFALGKTINPIGSYIFILGIIMAIIGMKIHSPISLDKVLMNQELWEVNLKENESQFK